MRAALPLLLAASLLAACDTADVALPNTSAEDTTAFRITILSPTREDTLRLGDPFLFRAEVEAGSAVDSIGIALNYFFTDPYSEVRLVLFDEPVERPEGGARTFVVNRTVTIDSLYGVGSLDELESEGRFGIGMYGYVTGEGGRITSRYITLVE